MIHKTERNFRSEDIWRLFLLEQILTFCELCDNHTGLNHWKRNKFTWRLLQKCVVWNKAIEYHTHVVQQCFSSILEQSNPSRNKHYSVWASEKPLLNFTFLVSTNARWFHSYLRTPSGFHRMEKIYFNSHCQRNFFSKSCSTVTNFQEIFSYFILRILALVIGSCDPV